MGQRAVISLLFVAGVVGASFAACSGDSNNVPDGGSDATTNPDVKADAPSSDGGTDAPADSPGDVAAEAACTVEAGTTYLMDALEVAAGADSVCALRQDGTAACWGGLGGGSTPKTVVFPSDAGVVKLTHIALQASTACAIDTAGLVWCWGSGYLGALGNGTTTPFSTTPSVVIDATQTAIHAVSLGTGYNHICALTAGGNVLCWGDDTFRQLGQDAGVDDAGHTYSSVALQVPGITLSTLAKGGGGDFSAGFSSSTVAAWGTSNSGECGTAASTAFNASLGASFTDAGGTLPLRAMSAGLNHLCVVDSNNHVYCMGDDSSDQCGSNGATGPTATLVPELDAGVTSLSCGYDFTCAVDSAQHAHCFGANRTYGYLGVGNLTPLTTGVPQTVVDVDGGPALFPVARVSAGGDQACAILSGSCGANGPGQVVCWGFGSSGNLGNGKSASSGTPVEVIAPQ